MTNRPRPTHLKLVHPAPEPELLAQAAIEDLFAAMNRVTVEVERLARSTEIMTAFVHWRLAVIRRMTSGPHDDPPRAA
jgi:hypothetical protein